MGEVQLAKNLCNGGRLALVSFCIYCRSDLNPPPGPPGSSTRIFALCHSHFKNLQRLSIRERALACPLWVHAGDL